MKCPYCKADIFTTKIVDDTGVMFDCDTILYRLDLQSVGVKCLRNQIDNAKLEIAKLESDNDTLGEHIVHEEEYGRDTADLNSCTEAERDKLQVMVKIVAGRVNAINPRDDSRSDIEDALDEIRELIYPTKTMTTGSNEPEKRQVK